jgi:hypothetical protein
MVGHTLRFNSVVRALEEHIDEVGAIHTISMCQRLEPPQREWMDDFSLASGGVILHTGTHMFDLLRYLSGDEVRRVYCETDRIFYEELEDMFVATLRLRNSKIRCVIDAARYTGGRSGRIEIVGEQGQLMGDHVHGYGMIIRGAKPVPLDIPPPVNTVEQALRTFLHAFLHDEPPPISVLDGFQCVEIAEACYYSAVGDAKLSTRTKKKAGAAPVTTMMTTSGQLDAAPQPSGIQERVVWHGTTFFDQHYLQGFAAFNPELPSEQVDFIVKTLHLHPTAKSSIWDAAADAIAWPWGAGVSGGRLRPLRDPVDRLVRKRQPLVSH